MTAPDPGDRGHWLSRPRSVRWLRRAGALLLAGTLLAQVWMHVHDYFGIDAWFGFNAVYGFITCVAMVLVARVLGRWLKRPDDYYHDDA